MFAEFYVIGIAVYLLLLALSWVFYKRLNETAINVGIAVGFLLMVIGVIIWFWEAIT